MRGDYTYSNKTFSVEALPANCVKAADRLRRSFAAHFRTENALYRSNGRAVADCGLTEIGELSGDVAASVEDDSCVAPRRTLHPADMPVTVNHAPPEMAIVSERRGSARSRCAFSRDHAVRYQIGHQLRRSDRKVARRAAIDPIGRPWGAVSDGHSGLDEISELFDVAYVAFSKGNLQALCANASVGHKKADPVRTFVSYLRKGVGAVALTGYVGGSHGAPPCVSGQGRLWSSHQRRSASLIAQIYV